MAGEDGSVRLLDTRKMLSSSFVRGRRSEEDGWGQGELVDHMTSSSELDCYHNSIFDISWVAGGDKLVSMFHTSTSTQNIATAMFLLADSVWQWFCGSLGGREWSLPWHFQVPHQECEMRPIEERRFQSVYKQAFGD